MKRIVLAAAVTASLVSAAPTSATTSAPLTASGPVYDSNFNVVATANFTMTVSMPDRLTVTPAGVTIPVTLDVTGTVPFTFDQSLDFMNLDGPNENGVASVSGLTEMEAPSATEQVWGGSVHLDASDLRRGGFGVWHVGNEQTILRYDDGTGSQGRADLSTTAQTAAVALVPQTRKTISAKYASGRTTVTVRAFKLVAGISSSSFMPAFVWAPWSTTATATSRFVTPAIRKSVQTSSKGMAVFSTSGRRLYWTVR